MEVDGWVDACLGPRSGPSPCNKGEKGCGAAWSLVWCSEWCFKDSNKATCSFLAFHVKEMGGVFRRFKRANQFLDWESQMTKPYFLITDTRAAKPCMETTRNQALFTVVLCMDGRQERKAQRWVPSLKTSGGPIHICADTYFELTILPLLAKEIQPQQATVGMQASLKEDMQALSTFQGPPQNDHGAQVQHYSNQIQPSFVVVPHALQMNPDQTASGTDAVQAAAWVGPAIPNLSDMMDHVWQSLQSPEQVEHALKQAMPDCYED